MAPTDYSVGPGEECEVPSGYAGNFMKRRAPNMVLCSELKVNTATKEAPSAPKEDLSAPKESFSALEGIKKSKASRDKKTS